MRNALFMRLLAGLGCLLLAACFDIREEVWIAGNGSGRAELRYTVPESALLLAGGEGGLRTKIAELGTIHPNIRVDRLDLATLDGETRISVDVSTDSMLSLLDLKKSAEERGMPDSAAAIAGDFDVRVQWLDLDFTRIVNLREGIGIASLAIGREEREKRRISYVLHLPKAATETNATLVTNGGKTLAWEATLGEALKKPLVTRFRATLPVPWWLWVAAGSLVGGILGLVWWWRKLRAARS